MESAGLSALSDPAVDSLLALSESAETLGASAPLEEPVPPSAGSAFLGLLASLPLDEAGSLEEAAFLVGALPLLPILGFLIRLPCAQVGPR